MVAFGLQQPAGVGQGLWGISHSPTVASVHAGWWRHGTARRLDSHDVVVVGARCAGAATAMLLARQGFDVVARRPGRPAERHAVDPRPLPRRRRAARPLGPARRRPRQRRAADPLGRPSTFPTAASTRQEIKDRAGVDHLARAPPPRPRRDPAAPPPRRRAPTVQTGVSVTGTLTDATGRVTGVALRDRDGPHEPCSRRASSSAPTASGPASPAASAARTIERAPDRASTTYTYVAGLDADGFEFHVGRPGLRRRVPDPRRRGQRLDLPARRPPPASATPTGSERLPRRCSRARRRRSPSASRPARITSPIRTAVGLPNHVLEAAGPGWALVGDAGYHRDPITGHGITDAFRDAELLARRSAALHGEAPRRRAGAYAAERDRRSPRSSTSPAAGEFPPLERSSSSRSSSLLIDAEAMARQLPVPEPIRAAA